MCEGGGGVYQNAAHTNICICSLSAGPLIWPTPFSQAHGHDGQHTQTSWRETNKYNILCYSKKVHKCCNNRRMQTNIPTKESYTHNQETLTSQSTAQSVCTNSPSPPMPCGTAHSFAEVASSHVSQPPSVSDVCPIDL